MDLQGKLMQSIPGITVREPQKCLKGEKNRTLATKTVDSKFPITLIIYPTNLPSSEIDKVTQKIHSVNNYAILKSSKEGTCLSVSKVEKCLNFKT